MATLGFYVLNIGLHFELADEFTSDFERLVSMS